MIMCVIDYPKESPVQLEIDGRLQMLGDKSYFVTEDVDIERIGELINACGYKVDSVAGRRLKIIIEEI